MRLKFNALQPADSKRSVWDALIPVGTDPGDILAPDYWAHHAANLSPWDRIECRFDDGRFYAELIVVSTGQSWVKVRPIQVTSLEYDQDAVSAEKEEEPQAPEFVVNWGGPKHRYRVLRVADKVIVSKGHQTEAEAQARLNELLVEMA